MAGIAEALISLHATPREVPPFTDAQPELTPEDGYAAMRLLHEHRIGQSWRPVGRKIGFTNRTIWPRYGVYEPIWGWVYDHTLVEGVRVPLTGLVNPRIEPEVCFGLRAVPTDPEHVLDCLDWVAHSVEIVQSYFPDWRFKLPDCTAANGLHGLLVIGQRRPVADIPHLAERLPELEVVLHHDDQVVDRGVGANVLGSPLLALGHLVRLLSNQPHAPLVPGEVVTTGVLTDAHPVAAGQTWRTTLSGLPLPGLTLTFD